MMRKENKGESYEIGTAHSSMDCPQSNRLSPEDGDRILFSNRYVLNKKWNDG